jgi:bifunctional N-acetylglucosamine-1-phosphate-uridyltransferase/glucosamine-1-phosphate-acetyltransferase GlmU-like protein
MSLSADQLTEILHLENPFILESGIVSADGRLRGAESAFVVRDRFELARAHRRVRDRLVRSLMDAGATFLLPDSAVVDVDVRIGRDSIIYPGVVLEGQTTIGEETVIGPGCRIIDSWVGSGVELKGWNYISNTSVRNRAILEPYVRRGFD